MAKLLSKEDYVSFLRRYILVHSYIYYHLNYNVITDYHYDLKAKELAELQKTYRDEGSYINVFYDFDGSTGFDLFNRLTEEEAERIKSIAHNVIKQHKQEKQNKQGGR